MATVMICYDAIRYLHHAPIWVRAVKNASLFLPNQAFMASSSLPVVDTHERHDTASWLIVNVRMIGKRWAMLYSLC